MPLQIRDFTESALEKLLDTMVKEGREPDGWEAQSLLAAIGAMVCGRYVLAMSFMDQVVGVRDQRETGWPRLETTPSVDHLRLALGNARLVKLAE
ncbi:hypothetical protein [Methylibium sp.]|jgi:hypothetical protein|uniref:hypothetical protein n=1 Tax=Methylibium sp. TaxID=2067992 RepID=UPI003D09D17E